MDSSAFNHLPIFTKKSITLLCVLVALATVPVLYIHKQHKKDLLEISQVSSYIGCMQVARNPLLCSVVVAKTKHDALIKDMLDTKENEGIMIEEQGKQLISQPEETNGSSI